MRLQVSLEYILAGIMIFLVIMVVEINVFNMTTHTLAGMEQSEEYKKAEEIVDSILLSPGDPHDWWSYPKYSYPSNFSVSSIGLAPQGSVEAYVIDVRKLERFTNASDPRYVPPDKVRSLLGLSRNYDFSLRIMPVYNITINGSNGDFNITVRALNGLGVPNVNIIAFYVPSSLEPGVEYNPKNATTGVDGCCNITFGYSEDRLVVCASQVGVKVIKSMPEDLNLRVVGERLFRADHPLISYLEYKTAYVSGFIDSEVVSRYITIDGVNYYVEFTLWS